MAEAIDLLWLSGGGVICVNKGATGIGGLLLELLQRSCNAILFDDLFQLVLQVRVQFVTLTLFLRVASIVNAYLLV